MQCYLHVYVGIRVRKPCLFIQNLLCLQHVRGLVFDCQCHEQGVEAPERVQQNAPWWGSSDGARGGQAGALGTMKLMRPRMCP